MPSAPCARFLKEAILMTESTQTALDLPLRSFSLGESESDVIYLRSQFQVVRRDCQCSRGPLHLARAIQTGWPQRGKMFQTKIQSMRQVNPPKR